MPNSNSFWRKFGTIFSIGMACIVAITGYCDTRFKSTENEKDIVKLDVKVEKGFDKLEKKMECFNEDLTELKIQNAEILALVKYLKERTE